MQVVCMHVFLCPDAFVIKSEHYSQLTYLISMQTAQIINSHLNSATLYKDRIELRCKIAEVNKD